MTRRKRWTMEDILDTAVELLHGSDTEPFSVRRLAAALGTDSSSLYRHFRNKTELLREIADRVLLTALKGHRPEGEWNQRIIALAARLHAAFRDQPELAGIWARYGSGGAGSRLIMEELLQALRASGLPDATVPRHYHRIVVLLSALVTSEAAITSLPPQEREQGMEQFRVTVFGADAAAYPALSHFARDLLPLSADRGAAFDEILAAQLAQVEAEVHSAEPAR